MFAPRVLPIRFNWPAGPRTIAFAFSRLPVFLGFSALLFLLSHKPLVESFVGSLVRDDLFLEFFLHFFERLASLRARPFSYRKIVVAHPLVCQLMFQQFPWLLCFVKGGGESLDFLL